MQKNERESTCKAKLFTIVTLGICDGYIAYFQHLHLQYGYKTVTIRTVLARQLQFWR